MNPATAADSAAGTSSSWFFSPVHFPAQADLLTWCQTMNPGTAALLVLTGIVYLLFGYLLFRVLVAINAAAIGAYLGAWVGVHWNQALAGAIVLLRLLALGDRRLARDLSRGMTAFVPLVPGVLAHALLTAIIALGLFVTLLVFIFITLRPRESEVHAGGPR